MSNEHIDYFKRFAVAHMRWINFEFDRIVIDAVKKDAKAEAKRKEALRAKSLMAGIPEYSASLEDFVFDFDASNKYLINLDKQYTVDVLYGSIKLPSSFKFNF